MYKSGRVRFSTMVSAAVFYTPDYKQSSIHE